MTPERLQQFEKEAEERYPDGGNMYHTKREVWIACRTLCEEERESKDREISQLKQELETFKDAYVERNDEVNQLKKDKEELVEGLVLTFNSGGELNRMEKDEIEQLIQKHKP